MRQMEMAIKEWCFFMSLSPSRKEGGPSSPDVGGRRNVGTWKDWQSIRKAVDWSTAPDRNSSQDTCLGKDSSSEASRLLDPLLGTQYWQEMAKRSEAHPWKTSYLTPGSPESEYSQSWRGPKWPL